MIIKTNGCVVAHVGFGCIITHEWNSLWRYNNLPHNVEIKNFKYYTGITTKIRLAHSNHQQIIVFDAYATGAPA